MELMYSSTFWFWMVILVTFIGFAAQNHVKTTVLEKSKIANKSGLTGAEIAQKIMDANHISDVRIEPTKGVLTDHYSPSEKVVRLSEDIYYGKSVSAQAIAAHEVGHVIQHHQGSAVLKARTAVYPLAASGSKAAGIFLFLGLFAQMTGLLYLGIILLSFGVLFQLVTLPVEFDASNRAIRQLRALDLTDEYTEVGTRKVLSAAALTYVVAALAAIANLMRLIMIARNRR